MKNCIDFFESMDPFGVTINFNYKRRETYKSSLGGLIFFIFALLSCAYISITFIYFYNRTTKTVYSYNKQLPQTGNFSFENYSAGLSVAFTCDKYNNKYGNLTDIFSVNASLIRFIRENGKRTKYKTVIKTHKCTNADFYNELNDSVTSNGLENEGFYCPENNSYVVGGIISDKNYSYYEVYVESRYDNISDNYSNLLYEYDCKLAIYFTDILIDVSNFEMPVSKFINYKFIQLTPVDFKKYNLYFNIKRFFSDENWFLTMPKETVFLGYSRSDEYVTGKGDKRYETKYEDYKKYAKFFIRIDTNEYITDRRYQKFTEFFSSSTSFISGMFVILDIFLKYINRLYCLGSIFERSFLTGKEGIERRKIFENIYKKNIKDPSVVEFINNIKSNTFDVSTKSNIKTIDEILDKSIKNLNTIEKMNKGNLMSRQNNNNIDSYEKINNNIPQFYEGFYKKNMICKLNNYLIDENKNDDNKIEDFKKRKKRIDDKQSIKFNSNIKKKSSVLRKDSNTNNIIDADFKKNSSIFNNYSNNNILPTEDKNAIQKQRKRTFIKNNFNIFNYQIDARKIAYYLGLYGSLCCVKKTNYTDEESRVIKGVLENFLELLDINNYLKNNKDIELMKYLLINQDEDILIGLLEKPCISRKKVSLFQIMTTLNKNAKEKKKTEEFWKRFSELLYQKDKNEFEKKLCYLVCSEINDLIAIKK